MSDLKVVINLIMSNLFQRFKGYLKIAVDRMHLYCPMAFLNIIQQKLIAFLVLRPVFALLISFSNLC